MSDKKNIEVSGELYDAIQQLKQIFTEMSGKPIDNDEDVLSILVSGFIDSVMHDQQGGTEEEGHDEHDEDAHDQKHAHHHHHKHDKDGECCKDVEGKECACGHDHKHH